MSRAVFSIFRRPTAIPTAILATIRAPLGSVFSLAVSIAVGLALGACTKTNSDPQNATKVASREVNLLIWANYLSPEAIARFETETNIKLHISNFSENEELLAKVQAGAGGIDVAVPSDYMVGVMTKLNLLQPLDGSKIPNKAGLDTNLLKQDFDPENKFSLPYGWSTAGIAVNRELYKGPIKSWKDFFKNKDLVGKISLLDDRREVTAAALKMLGFSVNSTDPSELDKAKTALKELRPRVKMFQSDVIDPLVNKEVAVAQAFSSDALQAAKKSGGKIEYIFPEEGGTFSIDNLVIVKNAKNIAEAHALINFLLSKENNVAFVSSIFAGPVVLATKQLLSSDLQQNPALFPPQGTLSKFEHIKDLGEATRLYDRLWTEVKAQ